MSAAPRFGSRLLAAMQDLGPLCVGIDPHPEVLFRAGLPDTVASLRQFTDVILEAVAGRVAAVKPQSAFFERHGAAGLTVLESVLRELARAGTPSILDVKRGDIGSTMQAYAQAYLADGAPLAADAVTVSPYLGLGSLEPALQLAERTGRGTFVLALTSNPDGAQVQGRGSPSVAAEIIAGVGRLNAGARPPGSRPTDTVGDVGLVVGATTGATVDELGLRESLQRSGGLILAPGVGAQGATPADVVALFAGCAHRVVVPVSRALLSDGLDVGAVRRRSGELNRELRTAVAV